MIQFSAPARAGTLLVKEVNDVRKLLNRPLPDIRPERLTIPEAELEEIWRRAWLEAARIRSVL